MFLDTQHVECASSVSGFSFKYKDTSASVSSQFQDKTI